MRLIDADALKELINKHLCVRSAEYLLPSEKAIVNIIDSMPTVKPFHNVDLRDVLRYIDGCDEDHWTEFVACMECRGWTIDRRNVASWCGQEFS